MIARKATFLAALALAAAAPSEPWAARVTWPTYLYEGPSQRYRVADELSAASPVQVLACGGGGWCRVISGAAIGYLPRDLLAPADAAAAPAQAPPAAGCFDARRAGYGAGKLFAYCPR